MLRALAQTRGAVLLKPLVSRRTPQIVARGLATARKPLDFCPYAALGVAKDASVDEIKRAYYAKIFELHPDRQGAKDGSANGSREAFHRVRLAYEVLGTASSRQTFDKQIRRNPTEGRPRAQERPFYWEAYDVPPPQPGASAVNPHITLGFGKDRIVLVLIGLMVLGVAITSAHVNHARQWYMSQLDYRSARNSEAYRRARERSRTDDLDTRMEQLTERARERQRRWEQHLEDAGPQHSQLLRLPALGASSSATPASGASTEELQGS